MTWIEEFPVENILLDAALLAAAFLLPSPAIFLSQNLSNAFWFAAPVQVIALLCAVNLRSGYGGRKLPEWLVSARMLITILAAGGFLWLFLVAFAVEKVSGGFPYWGFRFAFFVALFGGILAVGMPSFGDGLKMPASIRFASTFAIFFYLWFTESVLEVSVGINHSGLVATVLATLISYLPVRLAIAFQPPFSYWDLFSGVVCFALFLYSLIN